MTDAPSGEPLIHSHWTDVLPEDHPLAYQVVSCAKCRDPLHEPNNECMTTWMEWGKFALCAECFSEALKKMDWVLEWKEFQAFCEGRELEDD